MAAWTAAARQATNLARLSTQKSAAMSSQAANLIHRRGLSGGFDHHGPPKVNLWQDPLSPSKWKEEHFVIASLTGWGLIIFGGYKLFSGGKKDNKEEFCAKPELSAEYDEDRFSSTSAGSFFILLITYGSFTNILLWAIASFSMCIPLFKRGKGSILPY